MATETFVSLAIAILSSIIAVVSFFRGSKKESVDEAKQNAADIASMKEQLKNMQSIVTSETITDIKAIQVAVHSLSERLERLDMDVEKKIDQVTNKVDQILLKMSDINK